MKTTVMVRAKQVPSSSRLTTMERSTNHKLSKHDQKLRNLAALDVRLQSYTPQYTFLLGYILINTFLFLYSAVPEYKSWTQHQYRPWIAAVARGFGYIFNFNIALQMLLACRTLLTFLRRTRLSLLIPFDYALPEMHAIVGVTSFLSALLHAVFHSIIGFGIPLWAPGFGQWTHLFVSGVFLLIIYSAIVITSFPAIRKASYELFFNVHIIGTFLSLGLLVFHGLHKGALYSYKWILGPVLIYLLDAAFVVTTVKTASVKVKAGSSSSIMLYDGGIVRLSFKKPFEYRAGQYAQLCIPKISKTEWHPFTFASAPHEEDVVFFIKKKGSWTSTLYERCKHHLERKRRKRKLKFEVKIRGPYGAPAEHATQYDKVLLISGGVGATPFCSITKQMTHEYVTRMRGEDMIAAERHSGKTGWMEKAKGSVNQWSELLNAGKTAVPTMFRQKQDGGKGAGVVQLKNRKDVEEDGCENKSDSGNKVDFVYAVTNSCGFNTTMVWILMIRLFVNMVSIAFEYSDMGGEGVVLFECLGIQVCDFVLGLVFLGGLIAAIGSEMWCERQIYVLEMVLLVPLSSVPVIVAVLSWSHVNANGKFTWIYFMMIWPITIIVWLIRYFRTLGERGLLSGSVKSDTELCSSVDFIWTTKKKEHDNWLLEELKRGVERTRFVRLHRFITDEAGERVDKGMIRGHFGRPNWNQVFSQVVRNVRNGGTVGIFFCGGMEMGGDVKEAATLAMFDSRYRGMRNDGMFDDADDGMWRVMDVHSISRSFNVRFVFRRERF